MSTTGYLSHQDHQDAGKKATQLHCQSYLFCAIQSQVPKLAMISKTPVIKQFVETSIPVPPMKDKKEYSAQMKKETHGFLHGHRGH